MNPEALQVVEAFIAAINRHDVAGLSRLMSTDYSFVDSSGNAVSGRENAAAGWGAYLGMFPDYEIRVEKMLGEEALVAVFGSAAGTYNGKRGMIAENRITMPAAWKALVRNGEIALWQVYADWTEGRKVIEKDNERY